MTYLEKILTESKEYAESQMGIFTNEEMKAYFYGQTNAYDQVIDIVREIAAGSRSIEPALAIIDNLIEAAKKSKTEESVSKKWHWMDEGFLTAATSARGFVKCFGFHELEEEVK